MTDEKFRSSLSISVHFRFLNQLINCSIVTTFTHSQAETTKRTDKWFYLGSCMWLTQSSDVQMQPRHYRIHQEGYPVGSGRLAPSLVSPAIHLSPDRQRKHSSDQVGTEFFPSIETLLVLATLQKKNQQLQIYE